MKKVIKSININQARKNMILANSIRDKEGKVICSKGSRLDYPSISRLKKEGITFIYIYQFLARPEKENISGFDFETTDTKATVEPEEIKQLKPEAPKPEKKIYASNIEENEEEKYSIYAVPLNEKPPLKDVISIEIRKKGEQIVKDLFADPAHMQYQTITGFVSTIVDEILSTDETIISVQDLRDYDNYTYQHSVNLCVLGVTVGKFLNYDQKQLKEFGAGLLLHDFGKTKIPLKILNKPDRLTPEEFEIMKRHAEYGYQILSKKYKLPEITSMVIRHHHEKLDGTGYPMGLKGKQIPEWVQISTIVDIYDALTSDRIYKEKWPHKKAVEFLYERAEKWFNREYIKILETTIPDKRETFSLLDF